ncbi:MD-2-related lipid-recognition protein-like [Melitaea cinxia]|uniref:MD-2-related lipid-recognition protein-like n=1 Tax=Melitaea cinxia TaxID=113334 RepID=UPI001E2714EE|nr:MD-2-related lipid-recognition protein-like [Melitaea cinxia]
MAANFLLIFFALFGFAFSEVAQFTNCGDSDVCDINEVRITPCKKPTMCSLKKGTTPSIAFDFTPKFSSDSITTGLFWDSPGGEVPFSELDKANGCLYTSCPLEAGKKQELDYSLQLSKKLPTGKYTFKWKIWTDDGKECCFRTNIELKR